MVLSRYASRYAQHEGGRFCVIAISRDAAARVALGMVQHAREHDVVYKVRA
jgi:hypothetical protein